MADKTGKLMLIQKHRTIHAKNPKNTKKVPRRFYEDSEIDEARTNGKKYSAARGEDFIIVRVVEEIQRQAPEPDTRTVTERIIDAEAGRVP